MIHRRVPSIQLSIASLLFWYFSVYGCFAWKYLCVPHACLVPLEARRWCWILWNWSYRWLLTTILVLGLEPLSSEKSSYLPIPASLQPADSSLRRASRFLSCLLFQQAIWGEALHSGLRSQHSHQEAVPAVRFPSEMRVLLLWSSFKSKLYLPFFA